MESQPHMQLEFPNCIPMVIEGIPSQPLPESYLFPSQPLSESHLRTTLFHQNTQNDSIIGLGQSLKDIHADKTVSYEYNGLIDRGTFCLEGASFDSCSPSTNLASRNGLNDDANNSVISIQREVPPESLRAMFTGGCAYASSSSIPTTLSCGYDASSGDLSDKWDLDRFLMQQEMNRRASTSGLEPMQFNEIQNMNNQWVFPSSSSGCSSYLFGTSRSHSELSLSLATCAPSVPSNLSCSGVVQNTSQTRLGSENNCHRQKEHSLGFTSNDKPILLPPVISDSRYLSVLQEILSETSSFSLDSLDKTSYNGSNVVNSNSNFPVFSNHFVDLESSIKDTNELCDDNGSYEAPTGSSKKSQMLALLQMVDDKYNRCLDEIHMVISAFHAATELDPQLHSCFALQTISFFYKNLRERISNHILSMGMDNGSARDGRGRLVDKSFIQKQWTIQQLKRKDQLWRPQRGLPERSVSVLRAWMFDNFLHPYPKDAEKHLLAVKSGLTRSQVSNWFINARVRLWKPLVEEMCAEVNRRKVRRQNDEGINDCNNSKTQLCVYDYSQ